MLWRVGIVRGNPRRIIRRSTSEYLLEIGFRIGIAVTRGTVSLLVEAGAGLAAPLPFLFALTLCTPPLGDSVRFRLRRGQEQAVLDALPRRLFLREAPCVLGFIPFPLSTCVAHRSAPSEDVADLKNQAQHRIDECEQERDVVCATTQG